MRVPAMLLAASLSIVPTWAQCTDCDGDGYVPPADCDDGSAVIHPDAPEICDALDNDCDGVIDGLEGCDGTCAFAESQGNDQRLNDPSYSKSDFPDMVWTGTEFGVVWAQDVPGQRDIFFARLSADGLPLGPAVQVTFTGSFSLQPRLAWNGSGYGVTWQDDGGLFFGRFDPSGQRIGDDLFVASRLVNGAPIVWTGSGYGVVWDSMVVGEGGNNSEIFFALLDPQGNTFGAPVRVTNAPGTSLLPDVAWTGTGFGVAWYGDGIYFARLAADGTKIGADVGVTHSSTSAFRPKIEWSGTEFGLVWYETQVFFARLDASGSPIGPRVNVSNSPALAGLPTLVRTGNGYGVAWTGQSDGNAGIFFRAVSATGQLRGGPVLVSGGTDFMTRPVIAWSGTTFGVAWEDYRLGPAVPGVFFAGVVCSPGIPVLDVAIDILPGSDDNVIRLGGKGALPVAILGTAEFDATTVDPATVLLAGAPVLLSGSGSYSCQPQDVDGDGWTDLLCKVDKASLQLQAGDTVAVLLASTFDGQALRGQDAVRVLQRMGSHFPTPTRWPGAVISLP